MIGLCEFGEKHGKKICNVLNNFFFEVGKNRFFVYSFLGRHLKYENELRYYVNVEYSMFMYLYTIVITFIAYLLSVY